MLIGKFAALLTMNATKFVKGMTFAARSTTKMAKAAGSLTMKVGKLAAGMAGLATAAATAAGGAIAALTKRGIDNIDAMGNVATRLGLTTEALSVLQFAADQTGVSIETMNMALQRMTRRVAEAGQGTGEAKDALTELGLSATALAQLAPDQQFRKITEAMSGVANQGDKVRLAMKLFDSEGVSLVQTMAAGTKGLDDFAERAKSMGLTVSEEMVAKVQAAKGALDEMGMVSTGVSNILATELSPFVKLAAQRFVDWIAASGGLRAIIVPGIKAVAVGIAKVSAVIDLMAAAWHSVQAAISHYVATGLSGIAKLAGAVESFMDFLGLSSSTFTSDFLTMAAEDFAMAAEKSFGKASKAFDEFISGDRAGRVAGFFDRVTAEADQAAAQAVRNRPEPMGPLSTFAAEKETVKKTDKAMEAMKRDAQAIINATRTPLESLRVEREKLNKLFAAGLIDQETLNRQMIATAKQSGLLEKKTSGSLSQVVRGRFTIGGGGRKNPQVREQEKTNTYLERIAAILAGGVPARATA